MPDVFVYDELPAGLRNQIALIVVDLIGPHFEIGMSDGWRVVSKQIAKEHQLLELRALPEAPD